jgi:hypothetical protein
MTKKSKKMIKEHLKALNVYNKSKGLRNWVAKNNKHKGGKHKSKKDYDRKSLVRKLKNYLRGL